MKELLILYVVNLILDYPLQGTFLAEFKSKNNYILFVHCAIAAVNKLYKQKPSWSEEDEEYLQRAIKATKEVYPITSDWLNSHKGRVQPKVELIQLGKIS